MQNDAHSPEIEKGPENVKRQETCRRATFSGTMVFRKSITPENVNETYVSYRITFSGEHPPRARTRACARVAGFYPQILPMSTGEGISW